MWIKGENKRGQATIFIIIAVVILAGIGIYLAVKPSTTKTTIPQEFQQIESYYQTCINEIATEGIEFLGSNGGFIEEPKFVSGTPLDPLSSKMNFLGQTIPYWIYTKDEKIIEQAPTRAEMEEQLGRYIEERLEECDFTSYIKQGYAIVRTNPSVATTIKSNEVRILVGEETIYSKGEINTAIKKHEVKVNSNLGAMHDQAIRIYNEELKNAFLENYTVDVIRLYAPVDGVEITCAPRVWKTAEVFENIRKALEANIQQIRISEEKTLNKKEKYFTRNIGDGGMETYFRYSKEWFTRINIEPSEEGILMAEPVGNQEGLGIIGFCYVPYHFVYDADYPVMIQIFSKNGELFQYPTQVIIRGNLARKGIGPIYNNKENEVCKYKNKEIEVNTYDSDTLEPIETTVSFKCLNQGCLLGETKVGARANILQAPQCLNGFLTAKKEGYETTTHQISTNEENEANILLDKLYTIDLEIKYKDGEEATGETFAYFLPNEEGKSIKTTAWPEQKTIKLSEGSYNITVYSYENTSITLPATQEKKCFKVPRPGFAGVVGLTKEECYEIKIPGQKLQYSLTGGGSTTYYATQSELRTAKKATIEIPRLPIATSIEALQKTYGLLETKKADLKLQ